MRALVIVVAVLLLAVAGAWYFFYGPNLVPAAHLVPGDTVLFLTLPNAVALGTGYETSQLKKIVDSQNAQPLVDHLANSIGGKNLALLKLLLPDLSGQSFVALTHFDMAKPSETGFIAGMKPKPGFDNFDTFVQQVNATYPDMMKETTTGKGALLGIDYQWIQGKGATGRICVSRYHGWIVTTWGEASLQDWLERMQGKSGTPSLADDADYQKSVERVGKDPEALIYVNYHQLLAPIVQMLSKFNPGQTDYFNKRLGQIGGTAIGSRFEGGEIVDRFSLLEPRQAQLDGGIAAEPCPFDTLKFTGPHTLVYFAANVNWTQAWKNFQDQMQSTGSQSNPLLNTLAGLTSWAQSENIDVQKNIIAPLGSEYSLQMEWEPDALYPDLGVYLKVDKPDDFKPVITALIDTVRKDFSASAVINELNSGGHNYATLKMVQPMPVSPTITEDGPYFGFFLNEQHAIRSFSRDANAGLLHNDDFNRQIGDKRNGASEIGFVDTPHLIDRVYGTALPYISMGAMFNPTLASLLKGHQLPPDVNWLAPVGTWSFVASMDNDGMTGYSTSGVGNQGIMLGGGAVGSLVALQSMGFLPKQNFTSPTPRATTITTPVPGPGANPMTPIAPALTTPVAPAPVNAPIAPVTPASSNTDVNPATPVTPPDQSTH